MKKFHPAKPVSVYNPMNRNTFISFLRQHLLQISRNVYDASMKGLNSYLEISKDGSMIVHVEPEKLK